MKKKILKIRDEIFTHSLVYLNACSLCLLGHLHFNIFSHQPTKNENNEYKLNSVL